MNGLDPRDLPLNAPHEDEEGARGNRAWDDERFSEYSKPRLGALEEEE